MELIKTSISSTLKDALQNAYLSTHEYFNSSNKLINHRVVYCNKWTPEQNASTEHIVQLLKDESEHLKNTFDTTTLIQLNFLNAPPDCNNQLFHLDYSGDSISYFIPLVELSDLNGTEYLYFFDEENYKSYYDTIQYMNCQYFDRNEAIEFLKTLNLILNVDYAFKFANSDAFSLLYMPHYVYHRGQKNKTNKNRVMLNILFSIKNTYEYPIAEYVLDTEIDEKLRAATVLEKRSSSNII
jgi:hypothetical protein